MNIESTLQMRVSNTFKKHAIITDLLKVPKKVSLYLSYMKFIIAESKLEKVIFKYLDNQDFIQIKKEDSIFFKNSEGDEFSQIRYDKDGWCYIYYELINEISSFFSLKKTDAEQFIGRWVENTLQMKVNNTYLQHEFYQFWLKIPYK